MKDVANSCKKYWFMFLLSLLIAIRVRHVPMILIWSWAMSSFIDDLILAMLYASLIMALIVTLPIDYVCYKISKEYSSKIAFILWLVSFLICYGIYLLMLFIKLKDS